MLPLVHAATAPGQRVHSAMRLEFPAGDLLLVVLPTFSGQQGEVALWWAGKHDPMVTPLVRIYGTKAAMPAAQLVSGKESQ